MGYGRDRTGACAVRSQLGQAQGERVDGGGRDACGCLRAEWQIVRMVLAIFRSETRRWLLLRGRLLMECLQLPRRDSLVKCALAQCTLLDRDGGAALVGLDQRHVEPGALLQELDVAGAIDLGVGLADEEDAIGYLGGEPCESSATSGGSRQAGTGFRVNAAIQSSVAGWRQ